MVLNPLLQSVQIALQNKTQTNAMSMMDEVVRFCEEHENGKVFDGWDHQDELGAIKGVFMWYNCNEDDGWHFINKWQPDREDGDSIFLAFLFAKDTEAFKDLTLDFLTKCPEALEKKKLGLRYRSGFPKRVTYDNRLFKKILNN
jgi:hypothetical protein